MCSSVIESVPLVRRGDGVCSEFVLENTNVLLDRFSDVFEGDPEIGIVNKTLVDKGLFHNLIPLSSSQKSCVSRILTTGFVFIPNMTDFHFIMDPASETRFLTG